MERGNNKELVWVLRIKYNRFKNIPDYITTWFYFAIPAFLVFIPFLFREWELLIKNELSIYIKFFFGALWCTYGPYFIFSYERKYIQFWKELNPIFTGENIQSFIDYFDLKIKRLSKIISVPWCILIISIILFDPSYLRLFGINGWTDLYLYVFILLIIYLSYLTALGFTGTYITINIIMHLVKKNLIKLNPFCNDGVGGFSCIGKFSLNSTILFSTGILFIPILHDYAIETGVISQLLTFIVITIYGAAILLVFFIPMRVAFRKADEDKDKLLTDALDGYYQLRHCREKELIQSISELNSFNYLNFLEKMNLYPFTFTTMTKIILTALFPVLFYIVQMLLDSGSIFYNWDMLSKLFN